MTPRHRTLSALRGEPVDRVPLILEGFHHPDPGIVTDASEREILDRVGDQLPFFHSFPTYVNRYLVTPPQRMRKISRTEKNGDVIDTTEIDTPKGPLTVITGNNPMTRTEWMVKYPVETLDDIEKIRSVPWELPENLKRPDVSSLPDTFDERGILHAGVSSPFVCVAAMMSFQQYLELCITEFELIRDLTQICLDRIMNVLNVTLADNNIEMVWMGGCEWLTPPMGSPSLYDALVQHFEAQIIERIHTAGAVSHVHCHGNIRSTLESVIARGGDFVEPMEPPPDGDITLAEAKQLARGRITLGGNIEARILENEDEATVEAATRAAFEGGKERMILQTTAGPLASMTPRMLRNYHKMLDVWEELSPID